MIILASPTAMAAALTYGTTQNFLQVLSFVSFVLFFARFHLPVHPLCSLSVDSWPPSSNSYLPLTNPACTDYQEAYFNLDTDAMPTSALLYSGGAFGAPIGNEHSVLMVSHASLFLASKNMCCCFLRPGNFLRNSSLRGIFPVKYLGFNPPGVPPNISRLSSEPRRPLAVTESRSWT
jgi:hypothetical protein